MFTLMNASALRMAAHGSTDWPQGQSAMAAISVFRVVAGDMPEKEWADVAAELVQNQAMAHETTPFETVLSSGCNKGLVGQNIEYIEYGGHQRFCSRFIYYIYVSLSPQVCSGCALMQRS